MGQAKLGIIGTCLLCCLPVTAVIREKNSPTSTVGNDSCDFFKAPDIFDEIIATNILSALARQRIAFTAIIVLKLRRLVLEFYRKRLLRRTDEDVKMTSHRARSVGTLQRHARLR